MRDPAVVFILIDLNRMLFLRIAFKQIKVIRSDIYTFLQFTRVNMHSVNGALEEKPCISGSGIFGSQFYISSQIFGSRFYVSSQIFGHYFSDQNGTSPFNMGRGYSPPPPPPRSGDPFNFHKACIAAALQLAFMCMRALFL